MSIETFPVSNHNCVYLGGGGGPQTQCIWNNTCTCVVYMSTYTSQHVQWNTASIVCSTLAVPVHNTQMWNLLWEHWPPHTLLWQLQHPRTLLWRLPAHYYGNTVLPTHYYDNTDLSMHYYGSTDLSVNCKRFFLSFVYHPRKVRALLGDIPTFIILLCPDAIVSIDCSSHEHADHLHWAKGTS